MSIMIWNQQAQECEFLRQQLAEKEDQRQGWMEQCRRQGQNAQVEIDRLKKQLAEKDSEIERLKEEGNMPVKYYQPNGKGQVYAVYGSSSINFADSLLEQLATSQAREMLSREVVRQNHEWHENYDEYGGYPESELAEVNEKALALPADTSTLGAMIAEAGEVMRTRCLFECGERQMSYAAAGYERHAQAIAGLSDILCALPIVTLEDLQK